MNDLKEKAKAIIAKGRALNDSDLIQMGLDLLDSYSPEEPIIVSSIAEVQTKKEPISMVNTNQFIMSSKRTEQKSGKEKLYVGPRENKYSDNGEDKNIITPKVEPTARNRPNIENQKVLQVCETCGKKEKVLPLYARDYYRCESCLLKGKS